MDECSSVTENELEIVDCKHRVSDFTDFDTLITDSCVNRTSDLNKKTVKWVFRNVIQNNGVNRH